jgi:hypothetical protein
MTSTYTANLAAFLTVTIEETPINSLQELAASSQLKPIVKTGSNLETLFKVNSYVILINLPCVYVCVCVCCFL